jgi:SAM-dependent methyltransferase
VDTQELYSRRFSSVERERKDQVWQVLCEHFFQKYVRPTDTVLDIGAGYCEFINNIRCQHKIALDLSEEVRQYAGPDVRVICSSSRHISALDDAAVNVAFASNFFEHLPDKQELLATLKEIRRILCSGGRLLILQPNIRFLHGEYWDFLDHYIPLTDRTLVEALQLVGLQPIEVRPRFLPYTTKSRLPQHPWLVRLYLRVPVVHRVLGKQAWIVALKP